jgi:glycosyltransferase involved in cell wall biosynthesis
LLEAVAELRRRGVVLRIALMGDGPEAASLRAQAQALGLTEAVTFREASSDWHAVKAHLLGLDVTVFPEAGGLGVVDSFAAARGAVVLDSRTRNGPEAEMVVEGFTGARYPSADANSLADTLADLYREEDLLSRVSKQAAEVYRSSLTMDAAVEPLRKLIEPLLVPRSTRDDR